MAAAVGSNIADTVSKLSSLEHSKFYLHETVVAKQIGLKNGPQSIREQVSSLILAIRKGYVGNKKDGRRTGIPVADLKQAGNGTDILIIAHGRKGNAEDCEEFPGGTLSLAPSYAIPRYFAFGSPKHTLKDQIGLLKAITGDDGKLDEKVSARRERNYRSWRGKGDDDGGYGIHDVPAIAAEYAGKFWPDVEFSRPAISGAAIGRRAFDPSALSTIEKDMRELLAACNRGGARDRSNPLPDS